MSWYAEVNYQCHISLLEKLSFKENLGRVLPFVDVAVEIRHQIRSLLIQAELQIRCWSSCEHEAVNWLYILGDAPL